MPRWFFVTLALAGALGCKPRSDGASAVAEAEGQPPPAGVQAWTWQSCVDPARADSLVLRDAAGKLACEGKIDTLYSWGPKAKLDWLERQPWTGPLTRGGKSQPIFATQSAFATFGYGNYALRLKLKPGVRFRYFETTDGTNVRCSQLGDVQQEVAVLFWRKGVYTGVDFVVCSLGVVESWSFGHPEHLAEMRREVDWITAHDPEDYETYVKRRGIDEIFPAGLDGHAFDIPNWREAEDTQTSLAPGKIFVSPTAAPGAADRHFVTAWPNYVQTN